MVNSDVVFLFYMSYSNLIQIIRAKKKRENFEFLKYVFFLQ